MSTYDFPYSPERKKRYEDQSLRKSSVKEKLDAFIENDFAVLRKGKELEPQQLLLKNQNPLVLEYVKGIYDEYHIVDPLNGYDSYSRVTMTPSKKKTTKKQKMHLMSNQTIKYSSPSQLKASGQRNQPSEDFDLVEDENSLIRRDFHNNTTIRASMSYFDVGHQLKDQSSFAELKTKNNTLENEHESSYQRFRLDQSKKGLNLIIEEEIKPSYDEDESKNNERAVPRIQLSHLSQNEKQFEEHFYLKRIPNIQKASSLRRDEGYVDESFRYCVGCEKPLLHANIKHHEASCRDFQFVFQLPSDEIVLYLKRKINKFQENIAKASLQLLNGDANQLQQCSQQMMEESRSISEKGKITPQFERQYGKVVDIGKKWCLITEQINKVNWFLKIREKIKQEFEL